MATKEPEYPTLLAFLIKLEERLSYHLTAAGSSRVHMPLMAISEGPDSFTMDSIAEGNKYFAATWAVDKELDDQALVQAFVKLVTSARKHDPRLQKLFDKLVPKKASELTFWRRYCAHAHALLIRLAPTPEEAIHELLAKMPAPRPLEKRRFKPADGALKASGELSKNDIMRLLLEASAMMVSDETVAALGEDAKAGMEDGTYPNVEIGVQKLGLHYQLEFIEKSGYERMHGLLQIQPPTLIERFKDPQGADKPVYDALNKFVHSCQQAMPMAIQRLSQRPADDPTARRFAPLDGKLETDAAKLDKPRLLELVGGLKATVVEEETNIRLVALAKQIAEEAAIMGTQNPQQAAQAAQQAMMSQLAMWQREWFESQGIAQDVGMRALWAIPETFTPQPRSSTDPDAVSTNALLQAFGSLRTAIQSAFQNAMLEATKPAERPAEQRRFPPKEGEMQRTGVLSREFVLAFTTKCVEVLMNDESLTMLSACSGMQEMGMLSVSWQRELLEHLGVQMDFGCRALGDVPMLFGQDQEVLEKFKSFQQACSDSAQQATQMRDAAAAKEVADSVAKVELS